MMKHCYLIVAFLYLFQLPANALSQATDSLQMVFESDAKNSVRLEACKQLTFLLAARDSAKTEAFILKGISLSKQLADKEAKVFFESQRLRILLKSRQFKEVNNLCDQLLAISKKEEYHSVTFNCYEILGELNLMEGKYEESKSYLEKALETNYSISQAEKGSIFSILGSIYVRLGKTKEALPYLEKSLLITTALNDKEGTAQNLREIGLVSSLHGNLDKALIYYEKSLKLETALNNQSGIANNLNKIFAIYIKQGKYGLAQSYYEKSIKIYTQLGNEKAVAGIMINMGVLESKLGNFNKAIDYYETSLQKMQELGNEKVVADLLANLGAIYFLQGNNEKAKNNFEESLNILEENGREIKAGAILNNLGAVAEKQGDHLSAINYFKRSLHFRTKAEDKQGQTVALKNIGLSYLCHLNNEDSAFYYINQAIVICKEMGYSNSLRTYLQDVGSCYKTQGKISKALNFYYSALQIVEETQDTLGIAELYNSLASVYETQNNSDKALLYHQKALEQYQSISHISGIASSKNNIATFLLLNGQYQQALTYATASLESYQSLQDSCKLSGSFLSIGKIYSAQNKPDSAIYYLQQGTRQAFRCNSNTILVQSFIELGKVYENKQHAGKTFEAYQKAFSYAKASRDRKSIKEAAAFLYPIYQQRGQYKKAFETLDLYQASKDSLFNEENTRNLVQKELEYTYAKAEQEKALAQQENDALEAQKLQRQTMFTYMFVGGFIAMLLIAFAFYHNFRNKQKANVLLNHQKKELEELDQVKSRLFANISHELRTPLTLISSPIESLINDKQSYNTATINKLELVRRNSLQLKGLVNDILDLSKLESNTIELNEESTPLEPFLNRVFSNFDSLAKHLGISYSVQLNGLEDKWALLDTAKVEKILNNLLSNAIKYTPSGKEVKLSAHLVNQRILLKVSDTGNGIAATDLPHVFNRFFQSKQSDAPIQGGTGIGLALAKELTLLMDGKINVQSKEGSGSQFSVDLPFYETEVPLEIALPPEELTEKVSLEHLSLNEVAEADKKFGVLVVEDHKDMQQFLSELLTMKYHVFRAGNGKEALKILEKEKVDLIISDVMMPEMDGYTLLEHLKNSEKFRHLSVIMLTALDAAESKLSALTLGVDDYLTKPFSQEELLARTHNLLARHEVRLEARLEASQMTDELILEESSNGELEGVIISSKDSEEDNTVKSQTDLEWLEQVAEAIRKELENPEFQMADLANQFNMSDRQLYRKMKNITGLPPKKYQQEVALLQARSLLEQEKYGNVTAICYSIGMSNVSRFSQLYEARFGKKPKEYFGTKVS